MAGKEGAPSSEAKATQATEGFKENRRLKMWNRLMWGGFLGGLGVAGLAAILATGGLAAPWIINTLYAVGSAGVSLGTVGAGGSIVESSAQRQPKKA